MQNPCGSVDATRSSAIHAVRKLPSLSLTGGARVSFPLLIFRRSLDVVDNHSIDRALGRFQPKAKLLLEGRE